MTPILITLCIIAFLGILFLNVYFRVKVLKVYKVLVQNNIEFNAPHMFNRKKLEEEVLTRYPAHRKEILTFVNYIQFSTKCATALVVVISILAAILMFTRES